MKGLKYLLGPISMDADLTWVPSPKRYNFTEPLISLRLMMTELRLKVTKNQYKDFAMLLHSLNNMTLAARLVSSRIIYISNSYLSPSGIGSTSQNSGWRMSQVTEAGEMRRGGSCTGGCGSSRVSASSRRT